MNGPSPPAFDLFIAHASADHAWVHGFLLPALALPPDRVITPDSFEPGAPVPTEFTRAVQSSCYSVLVLSPAFLADAWLQFSDQLVSFARIEERRNKLIPVDLKPVELPLHLNFLVRLDATDEGEWPGVAARLRALLDRPEPVEAAIPCPYPGMAPFGEGDAGRFYGREKEIAALRRLLEFQPFAMVIGPSGSGKSSLVFAGLVADLKRRAPGEWVVRTLRPGPHPLAALREAAGDLLDLDAGRRVAPTGSPTLLLIVDQLEEVFVQAEKAEAAAFFAALDRLRRAAGVKLLLTMRADFYPDLMSSDLWPVEASHRGVEVAPLRGDGLREAIRAPAAAVGVFVEGALVERLVADGADEPGVLPLLQETLRLLWQERRYRYISPASYERLGEGARSGLAVAIGLKADAALTQLKPPEQALARRIFLRLVQFGQGRPDTRRQQAVADLRSGGDDPAAFEHTLRHLVDSRLLTASGDETGEGAGERRLIDIAHEALIVSWPALRDWLAQRREAESNRRRLEDKAAEWERFGRGRSGLLDEGELPEAERWLASLDAAELGVGESLPALVSASQTAEHRATRNRWLAVAGFFVLVVAVAAAIVVGQTRLTRQARDFGVQQQALANARATSEAKAVDMSNAQATSAADALAAKATAESERARAERQALASAAQSAFFRGDTEQDLPLALAAVAASPADPPGEVRPIFYRAADAYARRVFQGHTDVVASVAFSPDGKTALSGSWDSTLRLWDLATGRALRTFEGHTKAVSSVAFSPNGQTALSGSDDQTLRLWDVATGQTLRTFVGHAAAVSSVAFSPDGQTALSGSYDGTLRLWDVATGQMLRTFAGDIGLGVHRGVQPQRPDRSLWL